MDLRATAREARTWAKGTVARLPKPVRDVVRAARDADLLLFASGLAFYSLVSVVPTAVVGFWVASLVAGGDQIAALGQRLSEMAGGGASVESAFTQLASVGAGAGIGAVVAALWPATAYGAGLSRALHHISPTEDATAPGLRGRVKALLLVALLPLLLLAGLAASYLLTRLVGDGGAATVLGWGLALVGGWLATTVVVFVIYRLYGPAPLALTAIAGGAALIAAAIAVMSLGYVVYMSHGADWQRRVAGSGLAATVLLAVWLYLTNLLLLAGYFVAREADEHVVGRRAARRRPPGRADDVAPHEAATEPRRQPTPARR